MPMLYGEGMKAFTRLQEQIMANFDDDSIFAWWEMPEEEGRSDLDANGLLTYSPRLFRHSGNVVKARGFGWTTRVFLSRGRIRLEAPSLKLTLHAGGRDGCVDIESYSVLIRWRMENGE